MQPIARQNADQSLPDASRRLWHSAVFTIRAPCPRTHEGRGISEDLRQCLQRPVRREEQILPDTSSEIPRPIGSARRNISRHLLGVVITALAAIAFIAVSAGPHTVLRPSVDRDAGRAGGGGAGMDNRTGNLSAAGPPHWRHGANQMSLGPSNLG